jgi:hypothetical protein
VLGSKKEVMMFVEQSAMKSNQSLPLIVVEFVAGVGLRTAVIVHFDALVLDHHKPRVDSLDLGNQLLLGDRPGFGLLDKL